MGYTDRYIDYLYETTGDIDSSKRLGKTVVFGYTSDTDVLLTYDEKEVNDLISTYLKEEPYKKDNDIIDSVEDLARYVTYYMINGLGGEVDISNPEVVDYLLGHYKYQYCLGGTGAQGAAALASTGMPLLCHISDKNKQVCELMSYPGLDTIKDGKRVPLPEIEAGEAAYHFIFAYTKGDKFKIGDKEYEVPIANRVILDFDTIHKDIVVNDDFKEYLENNAEKIVSYNLSGFNGIIDEELTEKRLKELSKHYSKIKEKNPNCIIYFESAHYLSPQVKYRVYKEISPFINIMGMNEEELVAHTREHNVSIDKESLPDVIRGMDVIIEKYGVTGIIMHTKDYAMYYGDELKGVDLEKALTLGNLLSGTRARVGHYGNLKECSESIDCMQLSEIGLRFAEELETMKLSKQAVLVPSRYMEKPVCTIGLGDTFCAGVQFAFIN